MRCMRQSELSAEKGPCSPRRSPLTAYGAALGGRGRTWRPTDKWSSAAYSAPRSQRQTCGKVCKLALGEGGGAWECRGLGAGQMGTLASRGGPRRVSSGCFAAPRGGDRAPVASCSAVSHWIYRAPVSSSQKSAYLLRNVSGIFHLLLRSVSTSNSTRSVK